jgi:hypothetical protein
LLTFSSSYLMIIFKIPQVQFRHVVSGIDPAEWLLFTLYFYFLWNFSQIVVGYHEFFMYQRIWCLAILLLAVKYFEIVRSRATFLNVIGSNRGHWSWWWENLEARGLMSSHCCAWMLFTAQLRYRTFLEVFQITGIKFRLIC